MAYQLATSGRLTIRCNRLATAAIFNCVLLAGWSARLSRKKKVERPFIVSHIAAKIN